MLDRYTTTPRVNRILAKGLGLVKTGNERHF
jgi:hypothetical protein